MGRMWFEREGGRDEGVMRMRVGWMGWMDGLFDIVIPWNFFIYDILIDDSNGRVDTVQLCRQFDRARREVDHVFVDMIMRVLDLLDADR